MEHTVKIQTVGAGVVPMSICPITNTIQLLLGQERYVRGWSGSNKVSGFEGGNKHAESPERNAARECNEETLGLVYTTQENCSLELINGNYVMRITVGNNTKDHVTYLTLVPWIKDIGVKFKEIRSFLVELDAVASQFHAMSRRMQVLEANDAQEDEDGWTICGLSNASVGHYRKLRAIIEGMIHTSPYGKHPAVTVVRNEAGTIQRVSVNADHLEKTDIRYVSIAACNRMLNQKRAIIRPFFRPVLSAICSHLQTEQTMNLNISRPPVHVVIRKHTKKNERLTE